MNFRQIAVKNLKMNTEKYAAYFLSCSFCIMTFFLYSTLILDKEIYRTKNFTQIRTITELTLSMFFNFSILFIGYAYTSYIKSRSKEFGVYLTQGMTTKELKKIVLVENIIMAHISMFLGLLAGTLFSRIFFLIIVKISDIGRVKFVLGVKNYIVTIVLFLFIFIVIEIYTHLKFRKIEIIKLIKFNDKPYKLKKIAMIISLIGISLLLLTLTMGFLYGNSNEIIMYEHVSELSIFIGLLGLYLFIYGFGSFYSWIMRMKANKYFVNILRISQVNDIFYRNKNIIFLLTILGFIVVYNSSYGYKVSVQQSQKNSHFPSDIIFIEDQENKEQVNLLNNIVKSYEGQIKESKKLEFLEMKSLNKISNGNYESIEGIIGIISQEQVSDFSGIKIHLKSGSCIVFSNLAKVEKLKWKRGNKIILNTGIKDYEFKTLPMSRSIVLTQDSLVPDFIVIINDEDYKSIESNIPSSSIKIIHAFSIPDWRKTSDIVNHIRTQMPDIKDEIISKFDDYSITSKEIGLSKFMFNFTEVLLFIISGFILFFNLIVETDQFKPLYKKLFRIGITDMEIKKLIYSELKIIFFFPCILSSLLGAIYVFSITLFQPQILHSMMSVLWTIICYVLFYTVFYIFAAERVVRQVVSENII